MLRINFLKFTLFVAVIAMFSACSEDKEEEITPALEVKTFSNLYAPQTGGRGEPIGGPFVKFSFAKGDIVSDNAWDIAFRGTTILVNGGAAIGISDEPQRTGDAAISMVTGIFEDIKEVPDVTLFKQDAANTHAVPTGSGTGWYNYNPIINLLTPIAGKVLVVRTHDGKYAKLEILSYYKDAPANPDTTDESIFRYYTFRYVYQPKGTTF
ncbi:MAG: hypothetical protein HC912_06005 [Saprospiraceae bacterium]|nr:hypothetical protein [Saprospiraceae bacterium]